MKTLADLHRLGIGYDFIVHVLGHLSNQTLGHDHAGGELFRQKFRS